MLYLPVKGSEWCIASVRKGRVEMPVTLKTARAPCCTALPLNLGLVLLLPTQLLAPG